MQKSIVNHNLFGKGTVVFLNEKCIRIQFENEEVGEKAFVYPDAFIKFLVYEDSNLQKEITETIRARRQKEEDEIEAIAKEKAIAEERSRALSLAKPKRKAVVKAKKKASQ